MNREELNKTFMMISNWNKPFDLQGFCKKFRTLKVKTLYLDNAHTQRLRVQNYDVYTLTVRASWSATAMLTYLVDCGFKSELGVGGVLEMSDRVRSSSSGDDDPI